MTDEELDRLILEVEGQVGRLPDESKQQLTGAERKQRALVLVRARLLKKIKEARNDGDIRQEAKAIAEYNMLMEYGSKNILLYNFMRAKMNGLMWW